jgi:hypothetical protein
MWMSTVPSVGFCATWDILTRTWFAAGRGRGMDSLESLGDCPSETRTTSAVLESDIVIGPAEAFNDEKGGNKSRKWI